MGKTNFGAGHPTRDGRPANAISSDTPPLSPTDEIFYDALEEFADNSGEEIFYDALDYFSDEEVDSQSLDVFTPNLKSFEVCTGTANGVEKGRSVAHFSGVHGAPNAPANKHGPSRGSSKTAAISTPSQPLSLSGACARSVPAPRTPRKKAVLIGLNYERCGKEDLRLTQAIRDAHRFANTLTKLGYSSDNMRVVTDEWNQPFPSCDYLLECIDWLVHDASEGDRLFFMFSGHCQPSTIGKPEPHFVAADLMAIPRSTFQERLVAKVPAGTELTIVLDCCNAAGMIKLKYCVGRMDYEREIKQMNKSEALCELENPVRPVISKVPQYGSLLGMGNICQEVSMPLAPAKRTMVNQPLCGTPLKAMVPRHLNRSVVAGRPLRPITSTDTSLLRGSVVSHSLKKLPNTCPLLSPPPSPKPCSRRRGLQLVVEGLPIPYFEERQDECVSPAGKVLVWAGTGNAQKAFESSNAAGNSIVTGAICNVLGTLTGVLTILG